MPSKCWVFLWGIKMPLPNILEFIGTNVTQAGFKTAQGRLLEFIDELDKKQVATANGYFKSYATLVAANADIVNIPFGVSVKVMSFADGGEYYKSTVGATSLTKSSYDPLQQSISYTDVKLNPLIEKDEYLSSIDTRLLSAIQTVVNVISQFASEYQLDIPALKLEDETINTRLSRLTVSIQKIIQTISEDRAELDVSITNSTTAISAVAVENDSVNTRVTRLLVALKQLTQTVSESRTEVETSLSSTVSNSAANDGNISRLNTALQQLANVTSTHAKEILELTEGFFDEDKKLSRLLSTHQLTSELTKLNNFDPAQSGANKYVTSENIVFFPVPDNVIRIDIEVTGTLPTIKGTVLPTTTAVNVEGQVLSAYGTLEVQGSSSAGFPKKNWTLAFFSDAALTQAIKVKLGNMIPQEELVWKANFVDNTHSRNIAVNRIYDQMQLARAGFPKREVDFVNMLNPDLNVETSNGLVYQPTGATGHVDGFPAVVYINKEFYGIGTLNIGKKRDNYNLKKDSQTHIQIEANGNVLLPSLPLHPLDPSSDGAVDEAFEIRRPATWGAGAQASYERLRTFLALSQSDMQTAGIDNFINRKQMMDYIILCQVCDLWDHLKKNTLYTTWDGNVWNFMPYDLDTVFGLWFTGVYFNADTGAAMRLATNLVIPATGGNSNFGTLAKFRLIYGSEIDVRYAELRKAKIIDVDSIVNLCQQITRKFPTELLQAEDAKWNKNTGSIYSSLMQTGSIHQIYNWLSIRIPRVDTYFNYTS